MAQAQQQPVGPTGPEVIPVVKSTQPILTPAPDATPFLLLLGLAVVAYFIVRSWDKR